MYQRWRTQYINTFYFGTVCGLSLYEILAEKLSWHDTFIKTQSPCGEPPKRPHCAIDLNPLGNTSYPILEPHFVPGPFFYVLCLTGDFDKLGFAHASLEPKPPPDYPERNQSLWPPEVLSAGMCRQVTNKGMGGFGRTSD